MRRNKFKASDLTLVERAPAAAPNLQVGDVVELLSGSPTMLVVNVEHEFVDVARPGNEWRFKRICLRRVGDK